MSRELLANNASTTLSTAVTSTTTTSLSVTSAVSFPATGIFRVLIDSEIMQVTAVSGTSWTVIRGVENTAASTHSSGATVAQILTAAGLIAANQTASSVFGTLSSSYLFTASGTYQNVGVYMTLPEAGTYLLIGTARGTYYITGSVGNGAVYHCAIV